LNPAPNVRDDAYAPLIEAGRRELVEMICPTGKAKYFSPKGWTAFSQNSPSGKSPLATLLVEPSVAKAKGFATSALGQKADLNRRMTDVRSSLQQRTLIRATAMSVLCPLSGSGRT
jgi:hypothetical protein